jgi:hypothetical protein
VALVVRDRDAAVLGPAQRHLAYVTGVDPLGENRDRTDVHVRADVRCDEDSSVDRVRQRDVTDVDVASPSCSTCADAVPASPVDSSALPQNVASIFRIDFPLAVV